MTQIYSNNIASVIGGPLNELVSTITLLAGTGDNFPAPTENEFFLLTLIGIDGEGNEARWEIVKVIERDGDALIVQRGQDNTTAQQWATGTRIELRVTAAGIERGEAAYMWGNHAEQGYLKGQSGDDLFLTKEEADELYLSPEQGDELFLTEAEADELFLTPAEGDVLFLTQDEADALYIPDAPTSGLVYARANGDWVAIDPGEGGVGGSGGAGSINLKYDDITPNGGATYTLAIAGEATESLGATNLLVSVNGTIQESGKAYTTTGTEITFSENLTSEDVVDFVVELTNGSYWTQEGLNLSYDGAGTKVIVDQLEVKDAAQFDADVNVTGNVTAAKFVGDGSGLTGLSAGMVISDDPPENPETGDLWYSSEAGDEGLYSWDGEVWFAAGGPAGSGGGSGAGMVVSATEPTDPIEGMQWLNSDTAEVFIFDGAVWLEFPAGSGGGLWEASGDDIFYNDGNVSTTGDFTAVDATFSGDVSAAKINASSTIKQTALGYGQMAFDGTDSSSEMQIVCSNHSGLRFMNDNGSIMFQQGTDASNIVFNLLPDGDAAFSGSVTATGASRYAASFFARNFQSNGWARIDLNHSASGLGMIFVDTEGRMVIRNECSQASAYPEAIGDVAFMNGDGVLKANIKTSNGDATFIGSVSIGDKTTDVDRKQLLHLGSSRPWSFVQNGAGASQRLQLFAEVAGNKVFSIGGLDNPSEDVIEFFAQSGEIKAKGNITGDTLRGTRVVQDGSPVIDAKGLITTLTTLRKATMDETQDIRESLRSAIDELVAGFEQEIATMPTGDSE